MDIRNVFSIISISAALVFISISHPIEAMPPDVVPGVSQVLITTFEQDTLPSDTISAQRKNIVSVDFLVLFPALGYSRIIQITEKTGLVLYGSITPFFGFTIDTGVALAIGKNHHFFEPAGGYLIFLDNFYVKAGYRFQGKKGFVFRIAPGYSISEKVPWFTASLGYAF